MGSYRIEDLTFTYPKRERPALRDVNLTLERGGFFVFCGPSGCGKSTLLRQLKPSLSPHGERSGTIYFEDRALSLLSVRDQAAKIGFVMQSPENQIVTDKVWHELAFGLESLGMKTPEIRLRTAEMASFFGIQSWFHKSVTELSGGQKQILALASIMALQPEVLILDEPTSQLDPIAASEFLGTVGKINRELGVTVILTEHRLEEAFPVSTSVIVLDEGRVMAKGSPQEVGALLQREKHGMFCALPLPMRVWAACGGTGESPITVRDGARWLSGQVLDREKFPTAPKPPKAKTAVEVRDLWFRYEKDLPDVVKGLSYQAHYGQIAAVLGGNGMGKTTMLSLIAGLHKPYRGKIDTDATVYALPQNPQALFVAKTVREDLLLSLSEQDLSREDVARRFARIVGLCRLEGLLESHPYDLSGGEQQRAALGKVLLLEPKILLLDEPTKGLDAEFKQVFGAILRSLTGVGVAIILVSHDIEFCAEYADRCALFFDGEIVTENSGRGFFCGNSFYTTSANRMAREVLPEAVTAQDLILALGGKEEEAPDLVDIKYNCERKVVLRAPKRPALSKGRKVLSMIFFLFLLVTLLVMGLHFEGLRAFIGGGNRAIAEATADAPLYLGMMFAFSAGTLGVTLSLTWKRDPLQRASQHSDRLMQGRKLSKRTVVAAAVILLSIPLTIYVGVYFLDDRRFHFISMLILLQTMLPFALVFEGRSPEARELVIIAVLCGIAVAGRAAFFMLPQFKPVVALVIIAGVAFGGEAGFLVGAMSGFVSNMFFGQGPWTPYQMFAFGVIGFLAGVLFRKGLLSRSSGPLAVFGAFATFVIYGGIMNPAAVLLFQPSPTREMFLLAYLQGIPFDLIHAVATVTFLLLISRPMLEKLDRIKVKYGLVE